MTIWRWRVILSFSSLLITWCLISADLSETRAFWNVHPGPFVDVVYPYLSPAEKINWCLNAPPIEATAELFKVSWSPWLMSLDNRILEVGIVFLFWWFVGWRFDVPSRSLGRWRISAIVGNALGALLAICLLWVALEIWGAEDLFGQFVRFCLLAWGILLVSYFAWSCYQAVSGTR